MDTQHPADALQDRLPDPLPPQQELPAGAPPTSEETDRLLERLRLPDQPPAQRDKWKWIIYLLLSTGLASVTTAFFYQRSEIAALRQRIADLEKQNAAQQPPAPAQPAPVIQLPPPQHGGGLRIVPDEGNKE